MNEVKAETTGTSALSARTGRRLHPLPVRIMHWINAVVMLVMITSGWGIYDDDVIIRGVHFSQFWRLGDWAAWSLNWHFAGMWFLTINGLIYLVYGFATGRLREKLLPIRPAEIVHARGHHRRGGSSKVAGSFRGTLRAGSRIAATFCRVAASVS